MSLNLDGFDQFLSATAFGAIDEGDFSLSGWFYRDSAAFANLFHAEISVDGDGTQCNVRAGGEIECIYTTGGTPFVSVTTTSVGTGSWFHVFCTVGENIRKVWLNGGGEGQNTSSGAHVNLSVMTFGGRSEGGNLDGRVAEVAVWGGMSMGITEAEILAAGYSPTCLTHQLRNLGRDGLYNPLVRDLNWNSIGPTLSEVNGPVQRRSHPRIIYPGHGDNLLRSPGPFGNRTPPSAIIPLALNFER